MRERIGRAHGGFGEHLCRPTRGLRLGLGGVERGGHRVDRLAGSPGSREAAAYSSSGRWYRQDFGAVAYTVLSFDMPIAWLVDRYWVVASHFVSQLTKRHQQVVRGLVYLHER